MRQGTLRKENIGTFDPIKTRGQAVKTHQISLKKASHLSKVQRHLDFVQMHLVFVQTHLVFVQMTLVFVQLTLVFVQMTLVFVQLTAVFMHWTWINGPLAGHDLLYRPDCPPATYTNLYGRNNMEIPKWIDPFVVIILLPWFKRLACLPTRQAWTSDNLIAG
jgi:hypothetical protein